MKWCVIGAFVAIGVLWGSAWLFTPSLPAPPMLGGAVRYAIAAALLSGAAAGRSMARPKAGRDERPFPMLASIVLGLTLIGFPYALAIWAKGLVSVGMVAVLYAALPLVTVLLGERAGDIAGTIPPIVAGIGGVAFLVAQGIDFSMRPFGGMLLLGATVLMGAWSLNFAQRHIRPGDILPSSAMQCAVASVLLLLLSGTTGIGSLLHWRADSLASLTILAAAEGAIAIPLLLLLLSQLDAWKVASLQWIATLVSVIEAGLLLRGRPTMPMWLGAVMIVVATFWLMRSQEHKDVQRAW